MEKGQVFGRHGEHKGFEHDDRFAETRIHVVLQLVEARPRRIRMNVNPGGQFFGFSMKLIAKIANADFEAVKFVKKSRATAKENPVSELIPLGILAGGVAAIKRGIQGRDCRRNGELATPHLDSAA